MIGQVLFFVLFFSHFVLIEGTGSGNDIDASTQVSAGDHRDKVI